MARGSDNIAVLPRRSRGYDPTLPVILEFQWPSTAVANAPIPRSARGIAYVITSAVASMIAVMALLPIDQVVTATGIVVAASPTLLLQPLDTAIVRSIGVREGQRVKAGQVLAQLDPTLAAADQNALAARVTSLSAEVARWQAEARGQPFTYTGIDPDQLLQAAIYGHRHAEFDLKLENYKHKIDELQAMIARSNADIAGYRDRVDVAKKIEGMRSQLETLNVGSRLNTLVAVDNRAEMTRSMANAQQTAEAAKRDMAALTAERDGYIQNWRADVGEKLSDAGRLLSDAQELLKKARLHSQMVELRAERDGTVLSIAKVSPGSVMQSGQQLIALVPDDARLEVEANIPGSDNGFVRLGNPVVVKFDTFPFTQYGLAEGTVRTISPSSFNPQDEARNPTSSVPLPTTSSEPFYRARITLDRVELHDTPADFHLIPGMPVHADIKTGKRTVMSYFLSRMLTIGKEGMREP
ncbi:MAG TPA: HlyD family type I secretion periplasmic adaptor subunit [Stellaceae bacterium]|jgi:HlyD family secretion protein|nr:HlyD family type I secretion periplasmic adaptor subunit [Stellaceae bacterium]